MILLMDSDVKRQESFMEKYKIDINKYKNLKNICGENVKDFTDKIKENISILESYDILIVHRSDIVNLLLNLQDYVKKSNKRLVIFSGGNTSTNYSNNYYESLSLNSKTLYSNNLIFFIENYATDSNVLILAYGKKYKLNILLNSLSKINNFINSASEKEILFEDFVQKVNLDAIKGLDKLKDYRKLPELPKPDNLKNGFLSLKDLRNYVQFLQMHILGRIKRMEIFDD
ncbi:hypothetical protein CCY99_08785 [Helicobacter sp. 16-1353]|uniref:hypothetical protein n=1 Tax=Helicobacter sp. 16-1353 TaxID=2004996 RepID=UPI000DCCFF62|nr:hypothetical protein [Helicobacter sp. 16-1353]RAX51645.1 hypothetical protein CCY99_08785 [Helicobacter sp. 16-1353]